MTSHLTNGLGGTSYDSSTLQPSSSTTPPLSGFYGMSQARSMSLGMPTLPVGQWPSTPILSSPPVSFHSRPSSGNAAPLHSPLTAQVYSADTSLRTHSAQSIDVGDSSYSSLQQHSPDQMLPECASTEPSKYCLYAVILLPMFVCLVSCTATEKEHCFSSSVVTWAICQLFVSQLHL